MEDLYFVCEVKKKVFCWYATFYSFKVFFSRYCNFLSDTTDFLVLLTENKNLVGTGTIINGAFSLIEKIFFQIFQTLITISVTQIYSEMFAKPRHNRCRVYILIIE